MWRGLALISTINIDTRSWLDEPRRYTNNNDTVYHAQPHSMLFTVLIFDSYEHEKGSIISFKILASLLS